MKKTIGILGGMGPEATAHFYSLLIRRTRAARDQDHVPVIMWADPRVPDRTAAILRGGPSPVPALLRGLRALRRAGADFAVIPCLTAHVFMKEIQASSQLPFVHLVEETLKFLRTEMPRRRVTGLLASSGTIAAGLFQSSFAPAGLEVLVPAPAEQEKIMGAIYGPRGIKAGFTRGRPRMLLRGAAARLIRRGARVVIAGCTEVPLALQEGDLEVPLLDPMDIAARACLIRAGFPIK